MSLTWQRSLNLTGLPCGAPHLLLLLLLLASTVIREACAQMAPIAYEGSLRTDSRLNKRTDGGQSWQIARTASIAGNSFIWQPWFAVWSSSLQIGQTENHSDSDSKGTVASGDGRVLMFPRSRFPLEVYARVSDSSTDLGNTLDSSGDFRRTRVGLVQRYRTPIGDTNYTAGFEHAVDDSDSGGETSDELRLQMTKQLEVHDFDANARMTSRRRDRRDQSVIDGVFTGRHSYRPDRVFTLENVATVTGVTTDTAGFSTTQRSALLTSDGSWRPEDSKLTVTGSARALVNQNSVNNFDRTTYRNDARVGATYDVTDDLRASGSVSISASGGDAEGIYGSTQTATLSYSPAGIDLGDFDYSYFASATGSNRFDSVDGTAPALGSSLGHTISRSLPLTEDGVWSLSASAGQNGGVAWSTDNGAIENIAHTVTVTTRRTAGNDYSSLELAANDNRAFGAGSNGQVFQSVSLRGDHVSSVGRYVSWNASFTMQMVRLESDLGSNSFPVSTVGLSYRNGFLFGVRRLSFNTELSASANNLVPYGSGEEDNSLITWDNRFEYRIGRLDLRLRGTVTERDGNRNMSVFLSVQRRFDGVF